MMEAAKQMGAPEMGLPLSQKTCRKCNVILVSGENWLDKNRCYMCRSCNSLKGRLHYQANKERSLELQRKRLSKPSASKADAEYKSKYYLQNKANWKKYSVTQKAKEHSDAWTRAGRLLTWIRARAGKHGMDFDLDREWLEEKLAFGACEVTGIEFDLGKSEGNRFNPYCPSIDRIDSNVGYLKSNCRAVVWIYNMAKAEWSDEVVMEFAKALVNNNLES